MKDAELGICRMLQSLSLQLEQNSRQLTITSTAAAPAPSACSLSTLPILHSNLLAATMAPPCITLTPDRNAELLRDFTQSVNQQFDLLGRQITALQLQ